MDKPKTFTPGYTFADFELVEYLGGGQDGEVWKATRTSIDSTVAINFSTQTIQKRSSGSARK